MSEAKIDEYKKEKANRKANAKKARTKKKMGLFGGIVAGAVVVGLLVWGIVATAQDGGLSTIKDKKTQLENQQLVTQEFLEFMNSQNADETKETE